MPSNPTTRLTACLERLLYSDMAWVIGGLALGVAEAFTSRHAMNPDGLSYVEMAQTALRTGAGGLINGYWSPGYPALIAATFRLTRPTVPSEFPVVHGLNVVIFAVTLLVWRALLKSWETQPGSPVTGKPRQARSLLVPVGFGIFLLIALDAVGPAVVTPDLAVLAVTLLIALCHQRLRTSGSWAAAGALGLSAALAFWMKAVMFPLGAMFLALLLAFPPPVTRARAKVLAASVVWFVGAIPLIGLISARLGRVSYGETGHLNYAFYVVKSSDATRKENDGSSLVHPPRVLLAKPRILEFGTPIPGTFPLHYDPSYWSEGIRTRFDLRDQAHAVAVNASEYAMEWFSDYQAIVLTVVGLIAVYRVPRRREHETDGAFVLVVWSVLWLVLYAAVHVERRLTAPAFLLLVILGVRALLRGTPRRAALGVTAVLVGFVLFRAASLGRKTVSELHDRRQPAYLQLADRLQALGLTPMTRLAIVGVYDGYNAEFAHAARLPIAAEIVADSNLTILETRDSDAVKAVLAKAGIRAIVTRGAPLVFASSEWLHIDLNDGTVASVLFTGP